MKQLPPAEPARTPVRVTSKEADVEPIDVRTWARDYIALVLELEGRGSSAGEPLRRMGA